MGRYRNIIIVSLIFFVLVNTTYYWEGKMGAVAMLTTLLMIVYFVVLVILLLVQTYFAIGEKLQNKHRLFLLGLIAIVLTLTVFFPNGIVNFEKIESDIVFIAQREGVASSMTTLKLREDKTFKNRVVCFGIDETTGMYEIKGDTIFFKSNSWVRDKEDFYEFAVLERAKSPKEKYLGRLVQFEDKSDTIGMALEVIKNDISKSVAAE